MIKLVLYGQPGYYCLHPRRWGFFGHIVEGTKNRREFKRICLTKVRLIKEQIQFSLRKLTPNELSRKMKHDVIYIAPEMIPDIVEILQQLYRDSVGETPKESIYEEGIKEEEKIDEIENLMRRVGFRK